MPETEIVEGTVTCDECGREHPATYSHDGQHGEGRLFAVACIDGLTDYYREWRVTRTGGADAETLGLTRRDVASERSA